MSKVQSLSNEGCVKVSPACALGLNSLKVYEILFFAALLDSSAALIITDYQKLFISKYEKKRFISVINC